MDISCSEFNVVMEVILNDIETYSHLNKSSGVNKFSYSINGFIFSGWYKYNSFYSPNLCIYISHCDDDKKILKLVFVKTLGDRFLDIQFNDSFYDRVCFNNYYDISNILCEHNLIKPSKQKSARSVVR